MSNHRDDAIEMSSVARIILNKSLVVGIVVCFICHASMISHVSAKDTLKPGEFLASDNGDFLESLNERFRLKFTRQPGSSWNWYLCVQLTEHAPFTTTEEITIWVFSSGEIRNFFPSLVMDSDGRLVISSTGLVVNTQQHPYIKNTTATLLDTGNLVLLSPEGRMLWQSFDYPTNTWVQGMKLGWFGLKTPRPYQRVLTSWITEENPYPGAYTLGVDPDNTKQLVIMQRGIIYWHSGVWSGSSFPFLQADSHLRYFSNDNESYFVWVGDVNVSSTAISMQANGDIVNITVGNNEYSKSTVPNCDYFVNEGCIRPQQSNCSAGDRFNSTTGFIQWEQYLLNSTLGIIDCKEMCIKNCSCTAYAAVEADGTSCKFSSSTAYRYEPNVEALFVRDAKTVNQNHISPSPHPAPALTKRKSHHHKKSAIIAVVAVTFLMTLAIIFILCYMKQRKCCSRIIAKRQQLAGKEGEELPFFPFKSIEIATNYFSDENKLGQGGFGPVYKGILANGQEIAAKRLLKISGHGIEQFKNEVLLITKLQHRNLVRLLGCTQGDEKILIYEYLPNKSLDSILFDARKKICLDDWKKRVSIIYGIAQGLLYLHKYSRLRIIHRDLKTSNILLDIDMNPKISDFGTARIFKDNDSHARTKCIIGTYGYMSPEYAMDGLFSEKSDVFSFGVMVLEIVSGKRNNGFYNPTRDLNLLGYAWDLWIEGSVSDLIDLTMENTVSINEATRCIQIGLLCVQDRAADRPTMSDVVSMLSNESAVLPTPKQPGFFAFIGLKCDNFGNNPKSCSVNEVTISEIEGR